MHSYRLVVRREGRTVGHFETMGMNALEDACRARTMFENESGCQCELWVADSERRILESSPQGMKILASE
ncbi:TPA: cytoplasmic protein, partial [Klebsiella aerogenes]|nr:cytoplasmic protein [Klebsiella aerogenes]